MKINFRKITALAGSLLMAGATLGLASAAAYPAPFVSGGVANTAIVYGAGASALDAAQAGQIQIDLQDYETLVSGGSSVSGGDSYKFEKTSTKFHLGDNITGVIASSLDDDDLPNLLAEGKFVDDDNEEFDYTQKIDIGPNVQLGMFEEQDYAEDEPTIGFHIDSGVTVLNYTLDFSDEPLIADMRTTDLPIMGKTYYVLSNSSSSANLILTLLDSAESTVLAEGESTTVDGKEVSISYISSTEVKLMVDGQTTNSLEEGETQKLADGSYVGIKDILYDAKDTGISKLEFSIGSGKLTLTSESEVQINDEVVSGVTAYLTNSTAALNTATVTLNKIVLKWEADEDLFITESQEITMPGFEVVKLSFGGLTYPSEETIQVQQGGELYATLENFPLKDGEADINFLYATTSGTFAGFGRDASNQLVTANHGAGTQSITFDYDDHDYFVASWSDGSDAESYLMRATNFVLDGANNETDIQYYKNSAWVDAKSGAQNGDTFSIGNSELAVGAINRVGHNVVITNNSGNTGLNGTLYSADGMTVHLPALGINTSVVAGAINFSTDGAGGTAGHNGTSFYLVFEEENKDDAKADSAGDWINVTIGWDSSTTAEVEVSAVDTENTDATSKEIGDTDVWRDFTYSALATEILYNKPSSGQKSVKLIYHDGEVAADVYITSPEATVIPDSSGTGVIMVTDAEISSVATKNLIVVGGSCINSAAATLVGGAYCGAAWTEATGVGSGQFLIKGYASSSLTSKMALLVAGYEAADTVNAATYLRNQKPDTSVGGIGTTATATLTAFE